LFAGHLKIYRKIVKKCDDYGDDDYLGDFARFLLCPSLGIV
jgi:hypothetical protein